MKTYSLVLRPSAETDLIALHRYIAEDSGRAVASSYIERLEQACLALESFPERGVRRDDLMPGIRTLGFERRVTIAFLVMETTVEIARIFYGGQDIERALRGVAND